MADPELDAVDGPLLEGAGARGSVASSFPWRFTTPLLLGSTLNPINSSMIATALVPISVSLHVPVSRTVALVTVLYLVSAIGQPTAGKVASVIGARRVFLGGAVMVLVGGVLGALAQSLVVLLVARGLIGLGTSSAYPSAMTLIRRRAAEAGLASPPGKVLGGLQISAIITSAAGLPLGGLLVVVGGWRWVFLVNVPVALVTLVATLIWIPADPRQGNSGVRTLLARIDPLGIVAFAATMTVLLSFLFRLPEPSWGLLALAVVLAAVLVVWELRVAEPFIDIRLLGRNGRLTRTYLRYALIALCVYTLMYGVTQWMEDARGLSALTAGLVVLPMSVVSGLIVFPVSRRNLVRGPVRAAALASLVGSALLLVVGADSSIALIVLVTTLFGLAFGSSSSGNQIALYAHAPADQIGVAAGLYRTFGYCGSIASSAVTAFAFRDEVSDRGLHELALVMVAVSLMAIGLAFFDRRFGPPGVH
ncbi:MFS transporter [Streptomyces sp. NPDC050625]|uniref:MFS transporter n=1 Tax=Streptomyces sp. NPDC050625 TaxID=3154629 RepID=UPI00342A7B02